MIYFKGPKTRIGGCLFDRIGYSEQAAAMVFMPSLCDQRSKQPFKPPGLTGCDVDRHQGLIVGILQANTPGKYHVDARCIGCVICSEIAPRNFRSDHEQGYAYVYKQPDNDLEASLCAEVMDICPVSAIGDNGTGENIGPV